MAQPAFYIDSATGSNINAGDDKTVTTSTNGSWDATTNVFTAASGTPFSAVVAGDFAAVYVDGATTAAWIARVTSVGGSGASLTLNSTGAGTEPTTLGTTRSCTVGGKWAGPSGSVAFPFSLSNLQNLKNSSNELPIVYWKAATHAMNGAGITINAAYITVEGYTSTPGDRGRVTITCSSAHVPITVSSAAVVKNLDVSSTASTGNISGFLAGSLGNIIFENCVAHDIRYRGFNLAVNQVELIECEAYNCNTATVTNGCGFYFGGNVRAIRCVAHDCTVTTYGIGFLLSASSGLIVLESCIADTCYYGIALLAVAETAIQNCDIYNCTSSGIYMFNGWNSYVVSIENTNMTKNGGWGFQDASGMTSDHIRRFRNCGFGAGTQANSSGNISTITIGVKIEEGTVNYASNATPYNDPANGDFSITLAAAQNAGRAAWTQTASSYGGTTGYASIGAAQPEAGGGGGSTVILRRGVGGF